MGKTIVKRYSEAFKRQIVREYETGRSCHDLSLKYGITGWGSVERWVKQYGHEGFRHELVVIQRPEEREHERQQAERIRQLESAVAQLILEKIVLEASLAEARQLMGANAPQKTMSPSSNGVATTP